MRTDSQRLHVLIAILDLAAPAFQGGPWTMTPHRLWAFRDELLSLATGAEARELREAAADLAEFARAGGPRPPLGLDVVDLCDMVRSIPRAGIGADPWIDRCRAMAAFVVGDGPDPRPAPPAPPKRPCGRGAIARPDLGQNVVTLPIAARRVPCQPAPGGAA